MDATVKNIQPVDSLKLKPWQRRWINKQLKHGEKMTDGPFACPVCATKWERRTERLHGLRVAVFAKPGLPEPLTVQPGRTRPFLVLISEYSPPRD